MKLFQEVFLDRHGYSTEEPEPTSKELRPFKFLIAKQGPSENKERNPTGVVIKDWTRSIGVNSVIKAEHDAEEAGLNDVILVGNNFSLQARGMASRISMRLVSRGELVVNYQPDPVVF